MQYELVLEEGTIGFTIGPSAPLLRLALGIGIAPTYYVVMEREQDWPDESED